MLMMNIMIFTIKTLGMMMMIKIMIMNIMIMMSMMMMMMIKIMIIDIMIMMSMMIMIMIIMIPVGGSHDNYSIVRGVQSIHAGKDL